MKGRGKRGKKGWEWEGGERRRILEVPFLAGGGGGVRTSWFEAKSKAKKPDKRLFPRISHLAVASSLFKGAAVVVAVALRVIVAVGVPAPCGASCAAQSQQPSSRHSACGALASSSHRPCVATPTTTAVAV